jgi:hypothetical protein
MMKPPTLIGTMVFKLYGDPRFHEVGLEFDCVVSERWMDTVDCAFVITRGWPLFLEKQIRKIPKDLQDIVLDTIAGEIQVWEEYGLLPHAFEPQPRHVLLAEVSADLHVGSRILKRHQMAFGVLDHPKFHKLKPINAIALIATSSFGHVAQALNPEQWKWLTFILLYGLKKWSMHGRPRKLTPFKRTWDFTNVTGMAEDMKRWSQ